MNDKDKRVGWIRELEVGNSVVVKDKIKGVPIGYGDVRKITPTGKIDALIYRFDHKGECANGHFISTRFLQLVPFTPELKRIVEDNITKTLIASKMQEVNFDELSLEQLQKIEAIIN